jgi:hypothetical protein
MDWILQIIFAKLHLLMRIAVVASLTGYSFSTVNAAMHVNGTPAAAVEQSMSGLDHAAFDEGEMDHHQQSPASEDADKSDMQKCCDNFCSNPAVVNVCPIFGAARMGSSRFALFDEQLAKGELVPIHNPPSA